MRSGLTALVLLVAACDGPPAPADASTTPDAPALRDPTPPATPSFLPCPTGWTEREVEDAFVVCEPPSGAPCEPGTERFTDSSACVPVGAACPSGMWAEPPAGARVVYVRTGMIGGDGSAASPYGSIQTAIERAPPDAVILVARGTYDETIDVFGGLRVIGACAAETILAPSTDARFAVLASERGSRLEGFTIRPGAGAGGIEVRGELAIEGVVIEGAADEAIVVDGGSLDARALVVRDVRTLTPLYGHGLAAQDGTVTLERAIFERCPGSAIIASSGATIDARAVVVRDSGQEIDGAPQVVAQGGGELALSESLLEDATGSGMYGNVGGVLRPDQVVIRRMRSDFARSVPAAGIILRDRGRLEGRRVRVEDVDVFGITFALTTGGELEDVYVANVARTEYDAGFAISARAGLTLRRAWLSGAERVGVLASGPGAIELEDLTVVRTGSTEHFSDTVILSDLVGSVRRVRLADNRGGGLVGFGAMLSLTIEDLEVVEVGADRDQLRGRGIELRDGNATLARIRVERARELGLIGYFGVALELSDVRVLDTLEQECAASTCPDEPGGTALAMQDARASVSRFELSTARLCGVLVAPGGELDLADGDIRGALVGACVQRDDYDVGRLTEGVRFQDNGVNVQSTMHVVPPPSDPILPRDL